MSSRREIIDIFIGLFLISFSLAVIFARGQWLSAPFELSSFQALLVPMILSIFTLGLSFIAHELSHRIVAVHFGYTAEFRAFYLGLALSIMFTMYFGLLFAAPGGVIMKEAVGMEVGLIAAAGPIANLLLSGFSIMLLAIPQLYTIGFLGLLINTSLAFFNLLPIGPLDGHQVAKHNPKLWAFLFIISLVMFVWSIFFMISAQNPFWGIMS